MFTGKPGRASALLELNLGLTRQTPLAALQKHTLPISIVTSPPPHILCYYLSPSYKELIIFRPPWLLHVRCFSLSHASPFPNVWLVANNQVEQIRTTVTDLLKINHPVLLAGMNVAAGPKLAAAVTNAGGLGVIGGVGYTPDMLREQIAELKSFLKDKNAPFGVDLLLPQVGGSARKTK